MKSTLPTLILTALVITACAPQMQWTPTSDAKLSLRMAEAKCNFEKEKSAPTYDMHHSALGTAAMQVSIFEACMRAEGFIPVPKDNVGVSSSQSNAIKMATGAGLQIGRGKLCKLDTSQLEGKVRGAIPAYASTEATAQEALATFDRTIQSTMHSPLAVDCDTVARENALYLGNMIRVGF